MSSFWEQFTQLLTQNAKRYKSLPIPAQQVDVEYDSAPFKEGEAYCRLWLVEMRLAKGVEWFTKRYPIVHSAVRFHHGTQNVTVPYLAEPEFIKNLAQGNLDKVIQYNYPLTSLFPFNQGIVELQAGLFSMLASDQISKFATSLGRFSKLLPVPQLSQVLNLTNPVHSGIQDLFDVGESRLELGYHQSFTGDHQSGGSNILQPGYFAAILAEDNEIESNQLCIVNDSLRVSQATDNKAFVKNSQPLDGYSYMLFRVEKRDDQDWESLTNIKSLVYQAQQAVAEGKLQQVKTHVLPTLRTTIFSSPDIAKKDKRQMVVKIEDVLKEWGLQSASAIPKPSLYAIMQRTMPNIDAETEAELSSLEGLFSS